MLVGFLHSGRALAEGRDRRLPHFAQKQNGQSSTGRIPMSLIDRRSLLIGSAAATSLLLASRPSRSEEIPGVTATELKIGSTAALSGPVSLLGTIARSQAAYFDMVNDAGGIGGRKIRFIYYDDAFNPAKTVEQVRRLVESDEVAFLFSALGTAPN